MSECQPTRDPLAELRREQSGRSEPGDRVPADSLVTRQSALFSDGKALIDFVCAEFCLRRDLGDSPTVDEYLQRFPQLAEGLRPLLEDCNSADPKSGVRPTPCDSSPERGMAIDDPPRQPHSVQSVLLPERIGRYRVERVLGQGGFGVVFLARDEQLKRPVAVKVPHADRIAVREDADLYLTEARNVASLEHPHIVPVYDVGSSAEFPFFVVSKFVDGMDLATRLKRSRLSHREAAELVAVIAEVLEYAHKQGLVHRDVKPGNILIDGNGTPYVVDFGLALREEDLGQGPQYAGTPAYMSPEQACGEGHRVDGRSDIFSLGVVLYELLVGRPPFRGASAMQLLEQIASEEPRPPRRIDETIPKELERICLKALSKRASDRYATAQDLTDDLRYFLAQSQDAVQATVPSLSDRLTASNSTAPSSGGRTIKIVPKGLRSFDAQDADFFLELLPGPRDRHGLPDSIRFWKARIEETDPEMTFAVGLLYGPSGCGKTSLVKAGLLPRLAEHVLPVYVEAACDETEARLLHGLHKRCPVLRDNLDLKETLAQLRRGEVAQPGKKVLIVLDQFEQWLHGKGHEGRTELVQALRQCDGVRAQCLVMVRDDFWMAATRFLRELEIPLLEGQNSAAVDLFDLRHAEKVLRACGRAFGVLPERTSESTDEQRHFIQQALRGLAQEDKIVCVRLALFAEMMKGKPWTPAKLREVGGTEGIGVAFLEETFAATTAPPDHRRHQQAARGVLRALLPEQGTDIKGNMRSRSELLQASGYGDRQHDFDDLIRVLDAEVRLITPTDPDGSDSAPAPSSAEAVGHQYYQLTHDYLVPSLREWLSRKQKETRRGRAELRLADCAALWKAKRENRYLPSPWEFLNIQLLTDHRKWSEPQQELMKRAGRLHGFRSGVATVVAIAALFFVWEIHGRFQAAALAKRLAAANIAEVPGIVQELSAYRRWADPILRTQDPQRTKGSSPKLRLDLALLPVDQTTIGDLRDELLRVPPTEFVVVRDALLPYQERVAESLWDVALDPEAISQKRFQAACALAAYAPDDPRWTRVNKLIAAQLVSLEASTLVAWRDMLRPAKARLIDPLASIFRDTTQKEQARIYATETLADYAADQPDQLFELLADGELYQFPALFDALARYKVQAIALARNELAKRPSPSASDAQKESMARRQANVAVALFRLGSPEDVWPTLKFTPDPRVRSYIIHWLSPLGVDVHPVVSRLDDERDVTVRRALVLLLGEFTESQLSVARRRDLLDKLQAIYENEPDAGLHGAAEWVLRKWGQGKRVEEVVEKLRTDEHALRSRGPSDKRQWFVNTQKQTFVIIDAGEFQMGTLATDPEPSSKSPVHRRRIGRRFAISAHELTKAQFEAFARTAKGANLASERPEEFAGAHERPQTQMTWYEAAHYCDWLSEQEKIPRAQWCYDPARGTYGPGMQAKEKFWELSGYRLPTEAEWEYACRAGTVTSRYYGTCERLLPQYAWYLANGEDQTWPTARLKPNDMGLFDMLGNASEWCFDRIHRYPQQGDRAFEDTPPTHPIAATDRLVQRGGDFVTRPSLVHSFNRFNNVPNYDGSEIGFRPARTYR